MKPLLSLAALALLVGLLPSQCFALMEIEPLTKDRARELGLEIRAVAAGPNDVRIELEFATAGPLKSFNRAELDLIESGKTLVSAALREEQPATGRVRVSFVVDRAALGKLTLRVVALPRPRGAIGYELKVADFVGEALKK